MNGRDDEQQQPKRTQQPPITTFKTNGKQAAIQPPLPNPLFPPPPPPPPPTSPSSPSPSSSSSNAAMMQSDVRQCSICLETVENATIARECGHVFCYECITQWIRQRNRCPLCRQLISQIRHTTRNELSGEWMTRDEPVSIPDDAMGYVIDRGLFTIVLTPADAPLHLIVPIQLGADSLLHGYSRRTLEPDRMFVVPNTSPGILFVASDALDSVLDTLRSAGVPHIDAELHAEWSGTLPPLHPTFLDVHQRHGQAADRDNYDAYDDDDDVAR